MVVVEVTADVVDVVGPDGRERGGGGEGGGGGGGTGCCIGNDGFYKMIINRNRKWRSFWKARFNSTSTGKFKYHYALLGLCKMQGRGDNCDALPPLVAWVIRQETGTAQGQGTKNSFRMVVARI